LLHPSETNFIQNYVEPSCCYELTKEVASVEETTVIPEVIEYAKLLQVGDRKMICDIQELDVNDIVKMNITITPQERRKLYL
jgi:hypothetical protein